MTPHRRRTAGLVCAAVLTLGLGACDATDEETPTPVTGETTDAGQSPVPGTEDEVDPDDDANGGGPAVQDPVQDPAEEQPAVPAPPADEAGPDPAPPVGGANSVTPFVTWIGEGSEPGTLEVAAFVPAVIEQGGTCTATLVGADVVASAPAYPDASSTSCGLLVLDATPVAGQSVVVSYSSAASTGSSEAVAVTP
jgi:hypothetical protein